MSVQAIVHDRSLVKNRAVLASAWAITLAVSILPHILWNGLVGGPATWLLPARFVFAGACLALSLFWTPLRPLRPYLAVLLAVLGAENLMGVVAVSSPWLSLFPRASASTGSFLENQVIKLFIALAALVILLALKYGRKDFFLVQGDLAATAEPIPLLMKKPTSWKILGPILSVCISLGTLTFLLLAGWPSASFLVNLIPLIPAVLLYSAFNAFSEEFAYRSSFLATLLPVAGVQQSLLLSAAFFGLGHYYGVPYGVVGVLMSVFLGWLLGKSMVETRGFFWPWFIHLLQDIVIFAFMLAGSVTPGG